MRDLVSELEGALHSTGNFRLTERHSQRSCFKRREKNSGVKSMCRVSSLYRGTIARLITGACTP